MKRLLIALGALVAGTLAAQAQPAITLGLPGYGGNGCPQGTVNATLSPDGTSLSILFDQYIVEAGQGTNLSLGRKSCNVSIPVNVPNGFSVSVISVDYRGFNALPPGGRSTFNVQYFFAGGTGPQFTQNFQGPLQDDYLIHNELGIAAVVWSPCGASPILRTNASLTVRPPGNANSAYTMATVDSEDVAAALIYHLQWRAC